MRRLIAAFIGAVFLLAFTAVPLAAAEEVQVTAGVGDTTVRVSGWTAPSAFVTVMENSVVVGTVTADAYGRYGLLLVGQAPGIHNFRIFSRDVASRITDEVEVQVSAAEHAETAIEVFLPPAFTVKESPGLVEIEGSAPAGSTVVIVVGDHSFTTTADADGNWQYVLSPDQLAPGSYPLQCAALLPGGQQSYFSKVRMITLSALPGVLTPDNEPRLFPGTLWLGLSMVPPHSPPPSNIGGIRHPGQIGPGDSSSELARRAGYDIVEPLLLVAVAVSFVVVGAGWLAGARRRRE